MIAVLKRQITSFAFSAKGIVSFNFAALTVSTRYKFFVVLLLVLHLYL